MSGRAALQPALAKLVAFAAVVVIVWILAQTMGRVLLVFLVSVIIAMLLNPLVRMLCRLRIPRGLAVLMVFLGFAAAIAVSIFLIIAPARAQVEEIQRNLPAYTDQAKRQADSLQGFFDRHGINVDVKARSDAFLGGLQNRASEAADNLISYSLDVLNVLVTLIITLVASIYMLLDAPRIARFAQSIGGPESARFLRRTERTLNQYVKAQLLVSLIIGTSAGIVLWIYGVIGLFPLGATFAVAFAAWVFAMEFVPYVGPILGAIPPTLLALFTSPVAALWVVVAFIALHQLEGHIVVPKIMGSAVGVHPLVVIFGLLIGEQLAGIVGVLIAIPMVVIVKEAVTFGIERLGLGVEPPVADAAAIAVTQPAPPVDGAEGPSDPPGGAPAPAFEGYPATAPEPEPEPGPPPAREDPTRVMDSPELRPGP
jgi:predicted PurR-regulated permease PerM